jgi:hypothetical protein
MARTVAAGPRAVVGRDAESRLVREVGGARRLLLVEEARVVGGDDDDPPAGD